jgi:pilus assembly protein CpaB
MRRRVLILLAALVLAGISGAALLSYARGADRRALAGNQGVWVLTAREKIPAETAGADVQRLVERILVPAETVPDGTLTDWDPALDAQRLAAPLEPSQLLLRQLFRTAAPSAPPARRLVVPEDKLAVTVALSVAPQVAGDVAAGDVVTVYGTCPLQPADGDGPPRTRALLPRTEVIVIGEAPRPTPAPTASASASAEPQVLSEPATGTADQTDRYVVTLAVGPDDAQRLIHASRYCALHLAMLGAAAEVTPGSGVDTGGLFG